MRERRTQELRKGRLSLPGARYFVTLCAARPCQVLVRPDVTHAIIRAIETLHHTNDITLHCATVMPDHVHLLFTLGQRLRLQQIVARLKSQTRGVLGSAACRWQNNFFEHRLRPNEQTEPYGFYIFMNPYRALLTDKHTQWPGWFLPDPTRFQFIDMLAHAKYPPAEWISAAPAGMQVAPDAVGHD